jgi:glycosyltransferase involved in cell wall biosynthesis
MLINKLKNKLRLKSKSKSNIKEKIQLLPIEIEGYREGNSISAESLSIERVEVLVAWCFAQTPFRNEHFAFCSSLVLACIVEYPRAAYRLIMLLKGCGQSIPLSNDEFLQLQQQVLDGLKVGVAIITYNRLDLLQKNVEQISNYTQSGITLVVADDGSTDGTAQWCADQKIACSHVDNSGVVANKNRALYYLHEVEKCDVSILLEDDCYPVESGWEKSWALSALVWGHVNFAHQRILSQADKLFSGCGDIESPFRSQLVTGQCTATSYAALQKVGYLNSIFKGYGCGHVEWSERFLHHGFNGGPDSEKVFACINTGLLSDDAPTHKSNDDILRNRKIKSQIKQDKQFQFPWHNGSERLKFIDDVASMTVAQYNLPTREKTPIELNDNFLFIHISKTAGTSFRIALEKQYSVWGDYGNKTTETNANIQHHVYDQGQPYSLKNQFVTENRTWLMGHVALNKYSDFVSARNIISFVRNPVEQVISHYNHFVTHHGFKGALDEFLQRNSIQNFQSKNLNLLPISLVGFVGITEQYNESLDLINAYYDLNIKPLKINVNNLQVHTRDKLPASTINKIIELSKKDEKLYQQAQLLFKQRESLLEKGEEWTYGHFEINPNNMLIGCAYYSHSSDAVELQIFRNGIEFKTVIAKRFYGGFVKANFPRERYIGIHQPLGKDFVAKDNIEIFVKKTQQKLTITPLRIKQ